MKATLVSWTREPIETVLTVWDASKTEDGLSDIIAARGENDEALFQRIIDEEIPVAQFVTFNFVLEDVPISWREQAVRHRVGVRFGDNFAVDIIPEMDVSFWSQSMRIQSMASFAADGKYHVPESIRADSYAFRIYADAMWDIQSAYRRLVENGVPMEDARNLIPLGATHRIAMSINLQALKHIIGERGCWILQGSLWAPVIQSMVDEMAAKVHPIFRSLVAPPCVVAGEFKTCRYHEENIRRADGRDALPLCPLWVTETGHEALPSQREATQARIPEYGQLWGKPELERTWSW